MTHFSLLKFLMSVGSCTYKSVGACPGFIGLTLPYLTEEVMVIKERFPSSLAWGQAASQEGRDVSDPDRTATKTSAMAAKPTAMSTEDVAVARLTATGTN